MNETKKTRTAALDMLATLHAREYFRADNEDPPPPTAAAVPMTMIMLSHR